MSDPFGSLQGVMSDLDFVNFDRVHKDARNLVLGWTRRAEELASAGENRCFEAFIFCWIAFNGWYSCIIGPRRNDGQCIHDLSSSRHLDAEFRALLARSDFSNAAIHFHAMWPVFDMRNKSCSHEAHTPRLERAKQLREGERGGFRPKQADNPNWLESGFPLNWKNTVQALYQVRCNLFHGDKAATSENDRKIVAAALAVLLPFFRELLREKAEMRDESSEAEQ